MVSDKPTQDEIYRPIQAASVTGVFPGFARPHFVPEDLQTGRANRNTIYAQRVTGEQIIDFVPLERAAVVDAFPLAPDGSPPVKLGDEAIYVYAF